MKRRTISEIAEEAAVWTEREWYKMPLPRTPKKAACIAARRAIVLDRRERARKARH